MEWGARRGACARLSPSAARAPRHLAPPPPSYPALIFSPPNVFIPAPTTQSDVMIVAGTLTNKMAPALRKVRERDGERESEKRGGNPALVPHPAP